MRKGNQNIYNQIIMNRNTVKRSRTSQIPIFISKLYQMIDDKHNADTISWTTTADSFAIHSITKFTEEILPAYFKHRNFASFIRQLNMYGFRKIRHSDGDNVYMNENFKFGFKHLLKNISRKIKEDKEQSVEVYRSARHEDPSVTKQIQELKANQKNLQELCRHFITQNQRLLQENQNIVKRMQEDQQEKEKKLEELLVFLLTQKSNKAITHEPKNDQVLSITNYEHPQINYSTNESPLEAIGNAMDLNQQLQRARHYIQGIYNRKNRRKDNNCTIVQPQPSGQDTPLLTKPANPTDLQAQQLLNSLKPDILEDDQKNFMSINDFLNVEQGLQNHFDLQSSV